MKTKQALFITLVLVMLSGSLQVDAAALFASTAGYPWTKAALKTIMPISRTFRPPSSANTKSQC